MKKNYCNEKWAALICFVVICFMQFLTLNAQEKNANDDDLLNALKFHPVQKDVEYDIPTEDEIPQCKIRIFENKTGYIVTNAQNQVLRIFIDKNGDRNLDQWSYYRNGIEVYRDVATSGGGKADQYRWLNHGGTRIGVDINRDSVIDYWKSISAEEVSREVTLAIANNDVARFLRVSLSQDELQTLGLGKNLNDTVSKKLGSLRGGFIESVKSMNLGGNLQWYQLSAGFPGTTPAGGNGNSADLTVYENTIATVGVGKETKQISIGSIVKIGDNNWRIIDVPKFYDESTFVYTFIPQAAIQTGGGQADSEVIKLINEYQKLAAEIQESPANQRPAQHKKSMNLMLQIINLSTTDKDRELWIRLMADEIMEAAQNKEFPEAESYIDQVYKSVSGGGNAELTAYVRYRQIMTEYHTSKLDEVQAYTAWMTNLENFVMEKQFESTETGLDVMMQLAGNREMSSRTGEEPLKWYSRVVELAGSKPIGVKASGAIRRLKSVGQVLPFQATDSTGKRFDITSFRGSYVLLCFWDSHITDAGTLTGIKRESDRLASLGVKTVGVNLDATVETLNATASKLGLSWTQLFAQGGLENQLATYWGVQNVPSLILYGKDGKVLRSNISSINEVQTIIENDK
ncbi:MAG: peroxiredoxin family protein [Planctomycetaceae bacterium]|jgi:peroxiredoxin|nr:peroxiredoxin family protein [Planctomycetaceae bacterium]